ncbi:hypothetical protein CCACVL1_18149 [Corchorus capsularis]|uniref:Uncharacterized protein n=1 Tax=Corchorus capsularis TaxID=210143 RepID=A0A1R3HMH5_COCAP|nr:hypothetical protein CCACVL1_18149 [Corchorus capsularis]
MDGKGNTKTVKKEKPLAPPRRGQIKAKIFGEIVESLVTTGGGQCWGSEEGSQQNPSPHEPNRK